jgi:hypothetical protein
MRTRRRCRHSRRWNASARMAYAGPGGEGYHLGRLLLALEREAPALERRVEPSRRGRIGRDQDLSASGLRSEPCGGVHRVPDDGHFDADPLADRTEPDAACMHAGADRYPGPAGSAWPVAMSSVRAAATACSACFVEAYRLVDVPSASPADRVSPPDGSPGSPDRPSSFGPLSGPLCWPFLVSHASLDGPG